MHSQFQSLFLWYPKCTTCQKAKKWLDGQGVAYTARHIVLQNPTADELAAWQQKSGLPLRRFFNTSGQLYRQLGLAARLDTLSAQEQLAQLASDGMLVKRPILVLENTVLVGFKEAQWEQTLL